jgi:predicted TIM-barrel fold metal-dependent hydrolase
LTDEGTGVVRSTDSATEGTSRFNDVTPGAYTIAVSASGFTGIRWIISHSGAAVPMLAGRIKDRVPGAVSSSGHLRTEGKSDKTPDGVYFEVKRLYYECAPAAYPMPMAALRAFVPTSQLLFGTDYPVEPYETTVEQIPGLNLPADVQLALDRGNAERLWPRFKTLERVAHLRNSFSG